MQAPIVCLLMVRAASLSPILPNIRLARPGFGMMSAFAAAAGIFCARLTDVSPLLRPSFNMADRKTGTALFADYALAAAGDPAGIDVENFA